MTEDKLKETIRDIHTLWYKEDLFRDPRSVLNLHYLMERLFNYAGITSTLVENNPKEVSPEQFKKRFGISDNES